MLKFRMVSLSFSSCQNSTAALLLVVEEALEVGHQVFCRIRRRMPASTSLLNFRNLRLLQMCFPTSLLSVCLASSMSFVPFVSFFVSVHVARCAIFFVICQTPLSDASLNWLDDGGSERVAGASRATDADSAPEARSSLTASSTRLDGGGSERPAGQRSRGSLESRRWHPWTKSSKVTTTGTAEERGNDEQSLPRLP